MAVERVRPMKQFRVIVAHGPYSVGAKIQPTGTYRQALLERGYIEEVKDEPIPDVPRELDNRELPPASRRGRRAGQR